MATSRTPVSLGFARGTPGGLHLHVPSCAGPDGIDERLRSPALVHDLERGRQPRSPRPAVGTGAQADGDRAGTRHVAHDADHGEPRAGVERDGCGGARHGPVVRRGRVSRTATRSVLRLTAGLCCRTAGALLAPRRHPDGDEHRGDRRGATARVRERRGCRAVSDAVMCLPVSAGRGPHLLQGGRGRPSMTGEHVPSTGSATRLGSLSEKCAGAG